MDEATNLLENWWSLCEHNAGLKQGVEKFISDIRFQQEVCKELILRRQRGVERVWELQDELRVLRHSHLEKWACKEEQIRKLKEELATDQASAALNTDLFNWILEFKAQKLSDGSGDGVEIESPKDDEEVGIDFIKVPPTIDDWEDGESTMEDWEIGSGSVTSVSSSNDSSIESIVAPPLRSLPDEHFYLAPGNMVMIPPAEVRNSQVGQQKLIRDLNHLHALKMYLGRKVESEAFLKRCKQYATDFKIRVSFYCSTLMSHFVTDDMTLTSELCVSYSTLMNLFLADLEPDVDEKERKFLINTLTKLFQKFGKHYPINPDIRLGCFVRGPKKIKVQDQVRSEILFLTEMVQLKEQAGVSLEEKLKVAKKKFDEGRKEQSSREGDLDLEDLHVEDAEEELRSEAEKYKTEFEKQEAEIQELMNQILHGKTKLAEQEDAIRILACEVGLEPGNFDNRGVTSVDATVC